jgi:hypothetical protein
LVGVLAANCRGGTQSKQGVSPLDELPPHIKRITHFGERADWSHDGKRILFVEKTFGDVYEIELQTSIIRPMTHNYFHEGYTRALYLSNGDILLSGARQFDAANPWASRSEANAELWVLKKDLSAPPVPLGEKCSEGPAVSRRRMHIVWTQGGALWSADIEYQDGTPKLASKKKVLDKKDLPFESGLETQNLRPPDEKELIFSAYEYQGTEVCGVNLKSGKVVNYSNAPGQYDEPEGIFPDGKYTLVECDKHCGKGTQYIDLYKLALDGTGKTQRMTFFSDYPGYKASNPVVSDDGRYIAFQVAKQGDAAGVGRGILIFDIEKFEGRSGGKDEGAKAEENADKPKVDEAENPKVEQKAEDVKADEAANPKVEEKVNEPAAEEKVEKPRADEKAVEEAPETVAEKAPPNEPNTIEARIDRIKRNYGVSVRHKYNARAFFPARWLRPPISGEGSQMPPEEITRVLGAVEKFLSAYPKEVLKKNLTDIYLISGMKFYGKGFGAAYGNGAIYVNSEGQSKGYTEQFLVSQMHSELSSIFLMNYAEEFSQEAWKSVNVAGWEYNGTGVEMLGQEDIFAQTDELLKRGFLVKYSQSSIENDVNMFAFWAFTKPEQLRELTSKYDRIGRKYRLVVQFYKKIDPGIAIDTLEDASHLVNWAPDGASQRNGG